MKKKLFNISRRQKTPLSTSSQDFSKEIAEHMLDLVAISDNQGIVTYVSPSHKHLGYNDKDILGRCILDFVHHDDYISTEQAFEHFIEGAYNTVAPFRFLHANGSYIWYETIARKLDQNRIMFCSRDISKRKETEQKLLKKHKDYLTLKERQRAMIDNSKDVTIIINSNKDIIFASANTNTLFGWKYTELLERNICHIIPTDKQGECDKKLENCLSSKEQFVFEGEIIRKDGSLCNIELNCMNFIDHKSIEGILINISDISSRKKSEQEIRESEERYKTLHNATFGGIAMHDQGCILDCNLGLEEITLFSRKELIGMQGLNLIANDYRDIVWKNITSKYNESYEVKGLRKNGDTYDLRLHGKNIPYKGEEARVVEFRDITEQKEIERRLIEQQRLFKTMFNTIKEGIVITDTQGLIIMANESMSDLFGYQKNEIINKNLQALFPDSKEYHIAMDLYSGNENTYSETTFKHRDGHTFQGEIFGTKLFDKSGQWIGNIAVNRDITNRIAAFNELQKAKNQAEESSRLKTEFINNMSHEIRTPMNAIIGFSEMLTSNNLTEERRNFFINIIQAGSEQLLKIIDDILEISILETNKLKINESETCLNAILDQIESDFESTFKDTTVPLRLNKVFDDEESTFTTDEGKLKKIINNLLSNAVKYTNKGYIEIGYQAKGKNIAIYVKDTGSGIALENQELIFDRFAQAEKDIAQKRGGLGLGLSIAKANAELLGGTITVESELNTGSTFTITLPFSSKENDNTAPQEKTHSLNSDKFTILVAEDEDVNYLYLEAVIDTEYKDKYNILHAHNGQEAIDIALRRDDIDLVLMDIKMPLVNGLEATEKIKAKKPDLTIIAQTAYTTAQDISKAKEHGCDDFISKPTNRNDLIELINKYIDVSV